MEFRVLGSVEVSDEGRQLSLGGAKQRALLAILLLNANRVVSTDRMIDDLWGETPPPTAENAVQVYVSQLRRVLRAGRPKGEANDLLVTRPPGYVLHIDPDQLDLLRFERLSTEGRQALADADVAAASVRLTEALALWRGSPLDDFRFEPFAQEAIERLEGLRLGVQEDRIEAELELGRHQGLVPELEALVRANPLRERLREGLIVALYRSGRQADAIDQFQQLRKLLADELGIDPGPRLQRLNEQVLRQDPSLEGTTGVTIAAPSVTGRDAEPVKQPRATLSLPPTISAEEASSELALPVTALFADVVGSTLLGEQLGPDEVRVVIGECVSRMSRAVERFGGTIQAYMGDGICAYFGLPIAHEDDPERASRAALRILEVVAEQSREIREAWGIEHFGVRVGVNSGRTVVGVVGADSPQAVAFGDPNVAARLEKAAKTGTVVVGEGVARRLEGKFVLEPLGEVHVKGRETPVEAWQLIGAVVSPDPVPATPLVGRDEQLLALRAAVNDVVSGRGRVLLIQAEAGVGKSRMLAELEALLPDEVLWLKGECHTYDVEVPYTPIGQIVRRWLGVTEAEHEVSVRTKLVARVGLSDDTTTVLRSLARMLSVRVDSSSAGAGEVAEREVSPPEGIREWVESLARDRPVVVAVDDLHVADASTRTVLEELLRATDRWPVLVVTTARRAPDSEGWRFWIRALGDFGHRVTEIRLDPLRDAAIAELADSLVGTGSLDEATKREIIVRAEGNPFYAEQLIEVLRGEGALQRTERWTLTMSATALSMPPALEGLLVTRIQRLPPSARSFVQTAAVVGREFPVGLVGQVLQRDTDTDVASLLRAEVLREVQRSPELVCTFSHGLLQEATLSTLTPARARDIHGRVAEILEVSDRFGVSDERLAWYWYRSDRPERSIPCLERAAEAADSAGQRDHTVALLQRGLRIASSVGDAASEERLLAAIHARAPKA